MQTGFKFFYFSFRGLNSCEGDPVHLGAIVNKAGIQTVALPENLPEAATGVRVIVVQVLQAGVNAATQGFTKMWTVLGEKKCCHFICRNRYLNELCCFIFEVVRKKVV